MPTITVMGPSYSPVALEVSVNLPLVSLTPQPICYPCTPGCLLIFKSCPLPSVQQPLQRELSQNPDSPPFPLLLQVYFPKRPFWSSAHPGTHLQGLSGPDALSRQPAASPSPSPHPHPRHRSSCGTSPSFLPVWLLESPRPVCSHCGPMSRGSST